MEKEESEFEKHGGEVKRAEPMLRASSSSVLRSEVREGINSTAGLAAGAPGAAGYSAAALPCLNTNNCNKGKRKAPEPQLSVHRKAVYALTLNVLWLIERHGLERIGFLTLTFARHVVNYKDAQKALH